MKFIKKNVKVIIGFMLCIILSSGMAVYATYKYFSTDVSYTKDGTEMSVSEALNDLYTNKKDVSELNILKSNISQTDAVPEDILNGKKAYTKNGLITGTYKKGYDVKQYTFPLNDSKIKLDLGYVPRFIFIYSTFTDGTEVWHWSYDSLQNVYGCESRGLTVGSATSAFRISGNNVVLDVTSHSEGYRWYGAKMNVYAIKE